MSKKSIIFLLLIIIGGPSIAQIPQYIYKPSSDFYETLPTDTTLLVRMLKAEGTFTGYKSRNAKPELIDSLYYFEPLSLIFMLAEDDEKESPDSTSAVAFHNQAEILNQYSSQIKLAGNIPAGSTAAQRALNTEILQLMGQASFRKKYFEDSKSHGTIDSLLLASGKRFGLITMHLGYVRTPRNLKHEQRKGFARSIVVGMTGGLVGYSIYNSFLSFNQKSSSQYYVMIIDAKEGKTWYYRHYGTFTEQDSPLSKKVLDWQFNLAFNGFFWKKKF